MADQPNVFDNGDTPPVVNPPSPEVNKIETLLKSIKNENGEQKYDTLDKALEALNHSQQFIPQIKSQLTERDQEIERLKAELDSRETIESVVQRLTAKVETPESGNPPAPVGLDEQAVRQLVEQSLGQTLSARDAQTQYQGNVSKVQDALLAKFGDKTKEVLAEKAASLGTTPKELGELAGRNPALVLELFKAQGVSTPNPTVRGRNVEAINTQSEPLKRPEKSLLRGGTNKEREDFMKQIAADVKAKYGMTN